MDTSLRFDNGSNATVVEIESHGASKDLGHAIADDGYEDWSDADFRADVEKASAKIAIAAREAREDLLAGHVDPFPES